MRRRCTSSSGTSISQLAFPAIYERAGFTIVHKRCFDLCESDEMGEVDDGYL